MEEKEKQSESTACESAEETTGISADTEMTAEPMAGASSAKGAPPDDARPVRAGKRLKEKTKKALGAAACILSAAALFAANLYLERCMIHEEMADNQLEIVHSSAQTPVMVDDEEFARLTHVRIDEQEFDLPCKARDFVSDAGAWHVRDADIDMFVKWKWGTYEGFLINDNDEDVRLTIALLNPQAGELTGWTNCYVTSVKLEVGADTDFPMEVAGIKTGQRGGLAGGMAYAHDSFVRRANEPYDVTYSFWRESDRMVANITVTYSAEHIVQSIGVELDPDSYKYKLTKRDDSSDGE